MKNRRLKVSLGRTLNMGDYESYRVDVGLEAEVEDGRPFNESYQELFEEVSKQLIVATETAKKKKEEGRDRYRGR